MTLPDLHSLSLRDPGPTPTIPSDFDDAPPGSERYFEKLKNYAKSLPYSIESNARVQALLDFIMLRLVQCVEAKDYDPGILQWDILFT